MDVKRFTVFVTPELKQKVNEVKTKYYGNTTQNAMLIDLIKAGLNNTKDSKPQK
jgi:hypothetical protein